MEDIEEKKERRQLLNGDRTIWAMVFILCAISLIEVFSASSRLCFSHHTYSIIDNTVGHAVHTQYEFFRGRALDKSGILPAATV